MHKSYMMAYYKTLIEDLNFKPITTFWDDFTIAEAFGIPAVKDTFVRAFKEWKNNPKYLTELVLVLNWKIWAWDRVKEGYAFSMVYNALWEKADEYAVKNLKGEDANYFFRMTD